MTLSVARSLAEEEYSTIQLALSKAQKRFPKKKKEKKSEMYVT